MSSQASDASSYPVDETSGLPVPVRRRVSEAARRWGGAPRRLDRGAGRRTVTARGGQAHPRSRPEDEEAMTVCLADVSAWGRH